MEALVVIIMRLKRCGGERWVVWACGLGLGVLAYSWSGLASVLAFIISSMVWLVALSLILISVSQVSSTSSAASCSTLIYYPSCLCQTTNFIIYNLINNLFYSPIVKPSS